MKLLVTGAPGWLGTRLVQVLCKRGREVTSLVLPSADRFQLETTGTRIHIGDLLDPQSLRSACKGMDTVIHGAGIIHPYRISQLYEVNVQGTKNLLEEAIRANIRRFVYISSSAAAGTNTSRQRMMTERDATHPYMNYGLSKRATEDLLLQSHYTGKIAVTIIRPCWYYGPHQPDRQTEFFRMIKRGNPILFGDGQYLRSLSYIDNIVDAIILAEQKDIALGKTYWIADERPYTMKEIYDTVANLLGVDRLRCRRVPALASTLCRTADGLIQKLGRYQKEIHVAGEMTMDIACSIERACVELGYYPQIALEEGMRRSIEWCRTQGIVL